jgi:formylmethanofuran dehydrogenase subunit E
MPVKVKKVECVECGAEIYVDASTPEEDEFVCDDCAKQL